MDELASHLAAVRPLSNGRGTALGAASEAGDAAGGGQDRTANRDKLWVSRHPAASVAVYLASGRPDMGREYPMRGPEPPSDAELNELIESLDRTPEQVTLDNLAVGWDNRNAPT